MGVKDFFLPITVSWIWLQNTGALPPRSLALNLHQRFYLKGHTRARRTH